LHELTFRGAVVRGKMNPHLYEHVNIREQCSWAHKHDPAGATAQALRLIAAAVGKVGRAVPLEPMSLPNNRKALIIGGGIAGMKVAADLAGRGIPVILAEQSGQLGGRLQALGKVFPTEQPASGVLAALEARLADNSNVQILLNTKISAISGFIGNFQATLQGRFGPAGADASVTATVGVIVVATGFRPYMPANGEFLYQTAPGVVTLPEFVELLRKMPSESRQLVYTDRAIRSIAFIHCVGSRQLDGVHEPQADGKINNYCSRVCCTTVLQQALAVRQRFPNVQVYDLHQDIRTYGRGHESYYIDASKAGVTFMRYHGEEPPKVEQAPSVKNGDSRLRVTVKDYLTWGAELRVPVDMVVLAVGMMPGPIAELIAMLKLPVGEDRFLQEIHPKLRPVEISVNGVLLAGTAQGPMNIQETLAAAGAAAVKASAMFAKEVVELNPYVAQVDDSLCDGTGACVS
jgi:heterodisulfide reductase subunit A2